MTTISRKQQKISNNRIITAQALDAQPRAIDNHAHIKSYIAKWQLCLNNYLDQERIFQLSAELAAAECLINKIEILHKFEALIELKRAIARESEIISSGSHYTYDTTLLVAVDIAREYGWTVEFDRYNVNVERIS